jgi:hypothetical protein
MAVYKVIQDIESEDKIVGFLTLRTFIYALIAGALLYVNIRMLLAGVLGPLRYVFVFILFWPMALFGVLAAPLGGEQSTEIWILAHVRFYLKPRLRIWNQTGIQNLVTITVPKKIERQLTKNLTQREVRSRLKALATTLDTRGWAVKNVAVDLSANPSYLDIVQQDSDRLAEGSNLPTVVQAATDVQESDDIMDAQNNPTAQHFEALMQQEDEKRKQKVSEIISNAGPDQSGEGPEPPADYSILDRVGGDDKVPTSFVSHNVVAPGTPATPNDDATNAPSDSSDVAAAEQAYLEKEHEKAVQVHAKSAGFKPKIQPAPAPPAQTQPQLPKTDTKPMTNNAQSANLEELAKSGNAFSVATMSKLANRSPEVIKQISANEVEIDLHSQ